MKHIKTKYKLKVRKAQVKDMRFLFNIYNKNVAEGNTFSKVKTNYSDHKKWFKKILLKGFIFIGLKNSKIGYVRYDNINKRNFKISIAIKNSFKKKGLGRLLLKKSLYKINFNKFNVYAHVNETNEISKKFFLSCNFKLFKKNIYILKFQK